MEQPPPLPPPPPQQEGIHPAIVRRIRSDHSIFVYVIPTKLDGADEVDERSMQHLVEEIIASQDDRGDRQEQEQKFILVPLSEEGLHVLQRAIVQNIIASQDRDGDRQVQELKFLHVNISEAGFQVLQHAIEHNTMPSLTTFKMLHCRGATRLVEAFCNASSVTDLEIFESEFNKSIDISIIARLLQRAHPWPPLQRLSLGNIALQGLDNQEATIALQQALVANGFMKTLCLENLTVSSTVAVTIFQALNPSKLESLTLGKIIKRDDDDGDDLQPVMTSLAGLKGLRQLTLDDSNKPWQLLLENGLLPAIYKNTSLVKLGELDETRYPQHALAIQQIDMMCHANSLLVPQRQTGRPIGPKNGIWYIAIATLARRSKEDALVEEQGSDEGNDGGEEKEEGDAENDGPNNIVTKNYPGASAIFKIFQRLPTIVGKQLRGPVEPQRKRTRLR